MTKALIALTSYNGKFYDDGANTGVFFVEALHPYEAFAEQNIEVDFVSEDGTFGWDDHSVTAPFLEGKDKAAFEDKESAFFKALAGIKKPSDVNPEDYDIFLAAGGHGTLFDFPKATGLQKLILAMWELGRVVSAVCHGPCIFENLKDSTGEYFLKGKKVTGFTDEGESILGVDKAMEKYGLATPKEGAEKFGATYVQPSDPWASYAITDGKLITGVNPASAGAVAQAAIAAL